MERRDVIKGGALAAAATTSVGTFVLRHRGRPKAFDITTAAGTHVWIGNGERFRLEVRRGSQVIEAHDDLDVDALLALDSEHLDIVQVAVPSPTAS